MISSSPHQFHIPVMGLAFTIDTPIKVARYGISSVISIVEDRLIEMMRSYYYPSINQEYQPISTSVEDYKAKRITDYLNLVNTIVQLQVEKMKQAAFEAGSEIVKYFEMLPDSSSLKKLYLRSKNSRDAIEKARLEILLRSNIHPGNIDVNIMTKIDGEKYNKQGELIKDGSDAVAALRGFVNSDLKNSSVIFSAGMNPRLFSYLEQCTAFDLNENGEFNKKVTVKVSDYRSALIQGRYLAKKGIWVSEFRVESGLNCGGHAFATDGYLMGPILEEFKTKKEELKQTLFETYRAAYQNKYKREIENCPSVIITAQGGIGTHLEDDFLHKHYQIESTGWGTPFLLVPEATTVDEATLSLLSDAKENDVVLSHNSPLGVRFHYLSNSSGEVEKLNRISQGKPGSPCTEKHLAFNTEFTVEPICTASHKYQKLKLEQLKGSNLSDIELSDQINKVLSKECLCVGLSNSAAICYDKTFVKKLNAVNICPGPNIAYFKDKVSLQTMVDHIYGRGDILNEVKRPHMFIKELSLYINYLKEQLETDFWTGEILNKHKYYQQFSQNLMHGITYYRELVKLNNDLKISLSEELNNSEDELISLIKKYEISL